MARLFTREQGRPVDFATMEVSGSVDWIKAVTQFRPPVHVFEDSAEQFVETKYVPFASKDLKKITLELGGNDAAIIMPDVDLDEIAEKIFFGSFFNTAQICVATKRLYVHEDVYEGLRDRLIAMAKGTKLGDGSEQGTNMGSNFTYAKIQRC